MKKLSALFLVIAITNLSVKPMSFDQFLQLDIAREIQMQKFKEKQNAKYFAGARRTLENLFKTTGTLRAGLSGVLLGLPQNVRDIVQKEYIDKIEEKVEEFAKTIKPGYYDKDKELELQKLLNDPALQDLIQKVKDANSMYNQYINKWNAKDEAWKLRHPLKGRGEFLTMKNGEDGSLIRDANGRLLITPQSPGDLGVNYTQKEFNDELYTLAHNLKPYKNPELGYDTYEVGPKRAEDAFKSIIEMMKCGNEYDDALGDFLLQYIRNNQGKLPLSAEDLGTFFNDKNNLFKKYGRWTYGKNGTINTPDDDKFKQAMKIEALKKGLPPELVEAYVNEKLSKLRAFQLGESQFLYNAAEFFKRNAYKIPITNNYNFTPRK